MLPVLEEVVGLFRCRKDFDLSFVVVAGMMILIKFGFNVERTKAT